MCVKTDVAKKTAKKQTAVTALWIGNMRMVAYIALSAKDRQPTRKLNQEC